MPDYLNVPEIALPTDTAYKAVGFIETYTGRAFWPLKPTAEALSVIDIAHALSNQCRYSGHVGYFYSVAQHSCLLAKWLADNGGSPQDCLQMLMHDAPEAYLVDVPRPIKQYMPDYRQWDYDLNSVIRQWMGWADLPIPAMQDELDSRIIVDERAALMSKSDLNWGHELEPLGLKIVPWSPLDAERSFLTQYAAYSHAAYGKHYYINENWGIPVMVHYETGSDSRRASHATDLIEVDVRGGVGRIKVRDDEGILVRDKNGGTFPRPDWEWWHGKFALTEPEPTK